MQTGRAEELPSLWPSAVPICPEHSCCTEAATKTKQLAKTSVYQNQEFLLPMFLSPSLVLAWGISAPLRLVEVGRAVSIKRRHPRPYVKGLKKQEITHPKITFPWLPAALNSWMHSPKPDTSDFILITWGKPNTSRHAKQGHCC